jgi:Na+/H+ antiporter NhaD/arsenite permease-like protein
MTHDARDHSHPRDPALLPLLAVIAAYVIALALGWPQRWTEAALAEHGVVAEPAGGEAANAAPQESAAPALWAVTPFILLLAAIAVLPLIPHTMHWWESNLNRFFVAAGLAAIALAYYALLHERHVVAHWPGHEVIPRQAGGVQWAFVTTVLANALLGEFLPFIVLLFSLYTITGGIRITGDLEARPTTNAAIMAIGALLASLIGTTGAAMLLIRLLLETNRERKHVAHTAIFFIFIVCNCGGCLLPIGDPPLFLGYLQGVSFTWTLGLWPEWLFVNGMLLAVYWTIDRVYYHPHETARDIKRDVERIHPLKISGAELNGPMLLGVVAAVALLDPGKVVPGTNWHPWMYLREIVLLGLVAASLLYGSRHARGENRFTYSAIIEVAVLFVGIFICMQPALEILSANGPYLVSHFGMGPGKFFWASGMLSSFLDNAPTYMVFFETARDPANAQSVTGGVPEPILVGISLGSVTWGAMTYIGNGPNFMVKAIAEKSGVRMPSFFGYMGYSLLILLPILLLMDWIFVLRP